jgi:pyruvyltransferase
MFVWEGIENFGDILNKIIFEKLFEKKFIFTQNKYETEIIAIGSILNMFMYSRLMEKRVWQFFRKLEKRINKIVVLGSGFKYEPEKCQFLRTMDFKIVRGKLTEQILRKNDLINQDIMLGDLGLLSSYLFNTKSDAKYLIGIIPHHDDLDSPVFYDIYKKYRKECIFINVRHEPEKVIKEISSCKNIASSSLHGLIVADSFGIPNLWLENKYKSVKEESRFKYLDYYSSFGVENILPMEAIEFIENDIEIIKNSYQINHSEVERKQKELYGFCKEYLEEIMTV